MHIKPRVETTLFMLSSVDGKINSGATDALDVDRDWCRITGVKEGLPQYYEIEQTTDLYSLNTGRVMAKIGINEKKAIPDKHPITFILIDNKPHLEDSGIEYLCAWLKKVIIVTTNKYYLSRGNIDKYTSLEVIYYDGRIDFTHLLERLRSDYNIDKLTIQSGGTLNSVLIKEGLIDHLKIVMAPIVVGGKDTSTLVDGESIKTIEELSMLKALKLKECRVLKDSYVLLEYDVINDTVIE